MLSNRPTILLKLRSFKRRGQWNLDLKSMVRFYGYLENGMLKETISLSPGDPIDDIYRYQITVAAANPRIIPITRTNPVKEGSS